MTTPATPPARLSRAESFLGIHFDFHAGDDCTEIGRTVTREMIARIIDQVQPDYLQCDCKGHRGLSSYPTRVGYPAPGFVQDQLRLWREVTAERGVALFMHYSGVWDTEALKHHPSWAAVNAQGKRDKQNTSVFGPYVDKLLIPQLQELNDDYGVDGVWIDGDCWATVPDYSRWALRRFREVTGITTAPRTPEDPQYAAFIAFCREGFRDYVRRFVDALHRHNPAFQIASNWAFSSFMPEPVCADVDFLSGDYPLQNSVNAARLEGRCLANQGKPWDLMAWAFSSRWEDKVRSTKSIVQLQQEAAIVLALGGGFQAYFKQKRDGGIAEWTMQLMAGVGRFCRARQQVCHRAPAVPQIGLLYSGAAYYRNSSSLFKPYAGQLHALTGVLHALLDNQQAVEILMEHHLTGRLPDYPLLVIPEWDYLAPEFIDDVRAYVRKGGHLLLVGPKAAALFAHELDITLEGEPADAARWIAHDDWLAGTQGLCQAATLGATAQPFGTMYAKDDFTSPSAPAAVVTPCGQGTIAAVLINLGDRYRTARTSVVRDFLGALVRHLFPAPLVSVTGAHSVDVVVTRSHGQLAVNLVNTAGPHGDPSVYIYDEVPPLGPLAITIRTGAAPTRILRQPAGEAMPFTFADGVVSLTLPRLEIHDILVVEEG